MATCIGSRSWKGFSMSRLEFKATELTDTDVDFVSLVKRGANRLPFRITKGDDEMIDLYAIGRKMFQKAEPRSDRRGDRRAEGGRRPR